MLKQAADQGFSGADDGRDIEHYYQLWSKLFNTMMGVQYQSGVHWLPQMPQQNIENYSQFAINWSEYMQSRVTETYQQFFMLGRYAAKISNAHCQILGLKPVL